MKKVTVVGIAVLFLLVGFGYASAQLPQNQFNTNMGGALTSLSLAVTYEQELRQTTTLTQEGHELVTVAPSIGKASPADESKLIGNRQYDPILYMWVDGHGNLSQINMTWLDPNPSSPNHDTKIWTMSCTGGNQIAPVPGQGPGGAEIQDGTISSKPRETSTATARTDSVQGVLACYICPDGFQYTYNTTATPPNLPTLTNTVCNGGESYINGYLTFRGTFYHNLVPTGTDTITSASITGTVAGGSFDYVGDAWAAKSCTIISTDFECKANFTGTFTAKLAPCSTTDDPYCWSSLSLP